MNKTVMFEKLSQDGIIMNHDQKIRPALAD
jgi:hypothetical protein